MNSGTPRTHPINRIQNVLDYIHNNLELPLNVDNISQQSCWSRWQLQRVFQQHTGMSVAHYVRELKLSFAAERLINSAERSLDIAIELGFTSENAFSRAFKQMFSLSPREYRQKRQLYGVRQPFVLLPVSEASKLSARFADVKIETKPAFSLKGVHHPINGLFSSEPDFQSTVPRLWTRLGSIEKSLDQRAYLGVIDVANAHAGNSQLEYWAGYQLETEASSTSSNDALTQLETLLVPQQSYAVITHSGRISKLAETLEWFILHWLPNSNYRSLDGYELEIYPQDYQPESENAQMQYWLPVKSISSK
ncbi:AraC family transcriptional regulator [Vibrio sp. J1-1]|uniref:AraC family transcriptional regulator n=1 Tax=Vibrio sp. J1-1 TaxID=2912251 RepID=UPI001F423804|nr:AraC family transcriptional regulator [Vibrio sp. J1-1]MCF7483028.1 AraC family transcriptional regulator [Vibrio sp. J1-1]